MGGDDLRTYGEFFIKPTKKEMVYIGGGAGMVPFAVAHLPPVPPT